MDELYFEQIVARENEKNAGIVRMLIISVALLLFFIGVVGMSGTFLFLGILSGVLGFYFIVPLMYVEFEYLYMTKELTVDRIYNKERRKRAGCYSLSSMELMAPLGSPELAPYIKDDNRKKNKCDFTSRINEEGVYVIVMNDKDSTRIYFEPNEEILKAIKMQFPRQAKY